MTTFTIDPENNITAHATAEEAAATTTPFDSFSSRAEFAELAQSWPAKRLLAIWSSLPGVQPARKFQDRKAAVSRLPPRSRRPNATPRVAHRRPGAHPFGARQPPRSLPPSRRPRPRRPPSRLQSPHRVMAARPPRWWPCCNGRLARLSQRSCRPWDGKSTPCAGSWPAP
jgi:hypothetical protein